MTTDSPLRPSLWRTCRVLANRTRLRMFQLLLQRPAQTVSSVAGHLKLPLPVASQYLRALEARGFLIAQRKGGSVAYRIRAATPEFPLRGVLEELRRTFRNYPNPIDRVFRLATAFTHPRRIEMFKALLERSQTATQLGTGHFISVRAAYRHLGKLESRGFVTCRLGLYSATLPSEGLGRALAILAARRD